MVACRLVALAVPPEMAARIGVARIGVARITVEDAYARLVAEGYVAGLHGSGTFVTLGQPQCDDPVPGPEVARDGGGSPWRPSAWVDRLKAVAVAVGGLDDGSDDPAAPGRAAFGFDFRHGPSALDRAPLAAWRRVSRETASLAAVDHH